MKKKISAALVAVCAVVGVFALSACDWSKRFDVALPDFAGAGLGVANANEAGWYEVFADDFDGSALNEGLALGENVAPEVGRADLWTTSPHAVRWDNEGGKKVEDRSKWCWWCPDMVSVADGYVTVKSESRTDHVCPDGKCPASGRFTGGIETRLIKSDDVKGSADELLFSQAFGYFETRVKLPDCDGLWSAFWLQSSNQRMVGNAGKDGTEIDVYESAFRTSDTAGDFKMGHALLWDGYGKNGKSKGKIQPMDYSLYDGEFHTFALKWTPDFYVFYIDGKATWASNDGKVSKVAEYLRLTVEIDIGDGWGPHGQQIGQFVNSDNSDFVIDYVKVYQNKNYASEQKNDKTDFKGSIDGAN